MKRLKLWADGGQASSPACSPFCSQDTAPLCPPHPAPCPARAAPKTEMGLEAAAVPINCRYSRDLGVLQLTVFLVTLSYGSEWLRCAMRAVPAAVAALPWRAARVHGLQAWSRSCPGQPA